MSLVTAREDGVVVVRQSPAPTVIRVRTPGPIGETGATGPTGPTGATGATGAAGPTGAIGAAGADGKTILNGTGAPSGGTGVDGDFYYDPATSMMYGPKASGTWPAGVSLIGATGPAGAAGTVLPTGFNGETDDDVAPAGWVFASGRTIGSAASGATERANADTYDLYAMYWRTQSNTLLPIQDSTGAASTRGASALADFNANKRLPLPDKRGRVTAGRDDMGGTAANRLTNAGSGIIGTTLGTAGGAEVHTLSTAQLPAHTHGLNTAIQDDGGVAYNVSGGARGSAVFATGSAGSGNAHNNAQPTYVTNKIIKL